MKTSRNIFLSIGAGLVITLVLLSAIAAIIISNIDIDAIAHQSVRKISKKFNAETTYESFRLKLLPFPHLVIQDVNLGLPEQADIIIQQLILYPKTVSLLTGNPKLSRLKIIGLTSTVSIDNFFGETEFSLLTIKKKLDQWLILLSKNLPGLNLDIDNGKIDLVDDKTQVAYLANVDARINLPPGKINIDLQCRSSLWQQARLTGSLDPLTYDSSGHIAFKDIHIQNIPETLFPPRSFTVSRFSSDMELNFHTKGAETIFGEIVGSIPDAMIHAEGLKPVFLSCSSLKGSFDFSENQVEVILNKLVTPFTDLTGKFHLNRKTPAVALLIEGSVADVARARKAALVFAGKFRTAKKICDIILDGEIPRFSFMDQAESIKGLKNVNNIVIKGGMVDGTILTPKSNLRITEAFGEATLSKGILYGKQLKGRLGDSYGREGKFAIGMIGKQAPFYLETLVEADLSQLPPILKQFIKSQGFQREMGLVENTRGHALGKLILGDRKDKIMPKIRVDSFSLETDYNRIPLPIKLIGENFIYDNSFIDIESFKATVGRSVISDIAAVINWRQTPLLSCSSRNLNIDAGEIFPWFMSLAGLSQSFINLEGIDGIIQFSDARITGPFLKPAGWEFSTSGKTEKISLNHERPFGGPAEIAGEFNLTEKLLSAKNASLRFQDAMLTGKGKMSWNSEKIQGGETAFSGNMGIKSLEWMLPKIHFPLKINKETAITLSEGDIHWTPEDKFEFRGIITSDKGPTLSAEIQRLNNRLKINSLNLKDEDTDATFSLDKIEDIVQMDFSGKIHHRTLDKLLEENPFKTGTMAGKFHLELDTKRPEDASFAGDVGIEDVSFATTHKFPAKIIEATLQGNDSPCAVTATFLLENDDKFQLEGNLFSENHKRRFDLSVSSNRIDLTSFLKVLKERKDPDSPPNKDGFWDLDIGGNLKADTKELEYNGYTWSSVTADIAIEPKEINITLHTAVLCGINTPGKIIVKPGALEFEIKPNGTQQDLEEVFFCLSSIKGLINGFVDLDGVISAKGPSDTFTETLAGDLKISAYDGRIYRFGLLAKIFSLLNITEIFRGTLPDLTHEGFKYNTINISGKISNDILLIQHAFIDGAAMDLAFQGRINRKEKTMDITLLVAPLKTIDFLMKNTPVVKKILEGGLISIAFNISGNLSNPTIMLLPPSAVGENILNIMKNTLKLPITLIEPIINKEIQSEKENQNGIENGKN